MFLWSNKWGGLLGEYLFYFEGEEMKWPQEKEYYSISMSVIPPP